MLRLCVHVVVVVGSVVPLEAVPGVDKKHILCTIGPADAVHVGIDGEKGFAGPAGVGGIEPGAVNVVCGKDCEDVFPVAEGMAAGKYQSGGKEDG